MTASFPAAIKTFTRKRDLLDIVLAADINQVYDEVTALQQFIGTFPATNTGWSGTFDQATLAWGSVRARIQNIEFGLFQAFNDRVRSSGGTILTPAAASTVGLTIRAASGQTAALFQARNSDNTVVTSVTAAGVLQVSGSNVSTASSTTTFSNKTLSGASNTFSSIPTSSVIVSGSTNIQSYVEARPTVYYQPTAPTGVIPGSIWIVSGSNIDPFNSAALLLSEDPSVDVGVMGFRRINASTAAPSPSDGANGDVWLQYV